MACQAPPPILCHVISKTPIGQPHLCPPPDAQEAPVVDASSGQSRTDVLAIFMSAILLLTGLQWLSLKPREMKPVRCTAMDV